MRQARKPDCAKRFGPKQTGVWIAAHSAWTQALRRIYEERVCLSQMLQFAPSPSACNLAYFAGMESHDLLASRAPASLGGR